MATTTDRGRKVKAEAGIDLKDKAAAVAGGWLPGLTPRLRWPYRSASPERVQSIAERARREVPELFG